MHKWCSIYGSNFFSKKMNVTKILLNVLLGYFYWIFIFKKRTFKIIFLIYQSNFYIIIYKMVGHRERMNWIIILAPVF